MNKSYLARVLFACLVVPMLVVSACVPAAPVDGGGGGDMAGDGPTTLSMWYHRSILS